MPPVCAADDGAADSPDDGATLAGVPDCAALGLVALEPQAANARTATTARAMGAERLRV